MNIDRQKIIEWSKYNLVFLKYQRTIDTLKNAQPGEALPKNIALNTAHFARFFGELIEKFKIACVELERFDELQYELEMTRSFRRIECKEFSDKLKIAIDALKIWEYEDGTGTCREAIDKILGEK